MDFLDDNFLLSTPTSEQLYHEIASPLPLIDYHNRSFVEFSVTSSGQMLNPGAFPRISTCWATWSGECAFSTLGIIFAFP